jgi:hypothetical protein
MGIWNNLFKPKERRQVERALKEGRYDQAWVMCRSGQIQGPAAAEAQYKWQIYQAVASATLNDPFQQAMRAVATGLNNPMVVDALPGPEQTAVRLAHVANTLTHGCVEDALNKAAEIKNREGRAQALRKVAGHMACTGQGLDSIVQVIRAIPVAAYADEELRNLLIARLLLLDFDGARHILPHISQEIRRGVRPQMDFVERNHDNMADAQNNARDLVHPDDIDLTLALAAGAMGQYDLMAQYSRSVSNRLLMGTHATYASGLAYAGKLFEAVTLLENIQDDGHAYFLRLGYVAFNFPFTGQQAASLQSTFAAAEHYEGALAYWYHQILEHLVRQDVEGVCNAVRTIRNKNLRRTLAGLSAEFSHTVQCAIHKN